MKIEYKVFALTAILGVTTWVVDAVLDYLFFYEESLAALLFLNVPGHELYVRSVGIAALIAFALFTTRILARQEQAKDTRSEKEAQNLHLASMIASSDDAIISKTLDGLILSWNVGAERIYGYTADEVRGKSIDLLMPPTHSNELPHILQKIRRGERVEQYETDRVTKDGRQIVVSLTISPIRAADGKIIGASTIARDITERRRSEAELQNSLEQMRVAYQQARIYAEELKQEINQRKQDKEALQVSEERFRQVVASLSAHVYVTEVTEAGDHINLYLSPNVEALTGYRQEKFATDWSFWPSRVIHPDDRDRAAEQATRLARGQSSEVEYRLIRADDETIWVRDSARVHHEGSSTIVYGLVNNITERKRAEEEIQKLNEELEQRVIDRTRELTALYEVTAVGSEALDLQTMLARSLERVLAAMQSEEGHVHLLDQPNRTLRLTAQQGLPAEVAAQMDRLPLDEGLAGWITEHGEPLVVGNMADASDIKPAVYYREGSTYTGAPMRAGGQIIGVLGVVRAAEQQFSVEEVALLSSIADQLGVMVENARLRRQAELAAVMKERERLARELHDSVTQSLYSLTLLTGGGERFARSGTMENVEDYFKDLGKIAQQALMEMRLLVYELRPTILEQEGLVGALQQRLDSVEGRAGVKTRFLVEGAVDLPPAVEQDLYRITQEALNNTLKHAAATLVTVQIQAEADKLVLTVSDNGQGFEPKIASDTGGIGLVSIRERVEKLGGTLTVQSAPGAGTTVEVAIGAGVKNSTKKTA